MPAGYVALVLHAHLPFVRHPEHRDHLEERWLFEAIAECYLPLLHSLENLLQDEVPFRLTLSLSPPLVSMLRDPVLCKRFERYLGKVDRLLARELERTRDDKEFGPVVRYYASRQKLLWETWDRIEGDLCRAFEELARSGHLELWTCGATHGFLPALLHHPQLVRAQIALAVHEHKRAFHLAPRGIWLPECGYTPGVDAVLAQHGLAYTALETHALLNASPRPRYASAAPIITPNGVACFARDVAASQEVWSKDGGYPGDPYYREFYRDAGWDLPESHVTEFLAADGTRQHTGLKYYRVTGTKLDRKQPYQPSIARERAKIHAKDFVQKREAQVRTLVDRMNVPPVLLAPYDAELFGHWWFEGPMFLEYVLRELAASDWCSATTLGNYLSIAPRHDVAEPEVTSWGAGGYSGVWLDPCSSWMLRHVDHAARDLAELLRSHQDHGAATLQGRALRQAVREVLLLVASDWAFLIKTGTAPHYAQARFEAHLARFRRLHLMLESNTFDETWLKSLEGRDNIFPDLPLDWAEK